MTISRAASLPEFSDHVVQADQLLATGDVDRLFVDVRLGEPAEELTSFRACHIFSAVHAQIRDIFAGPPTPTSGNLPLPDVEVLQATLKSWGARLDTEIIVYGPTPAIAARGWWVLKWAGVPKVRLLDGGLNAWIASGGAVAQGDPPPRFAQTSSPLRLSSGNMPTIETLEVEGLDHSTILIDARDEASYLAGHIPPAQNSPASDQWTPARKLRSKGEIGEIYARAGITRGSDIVVYCGGGVLSALEVLTIEAITGIVPRLYVGSWSEWNKNPNRLARSAEYMNQRA